MSSEARKVAVDAMGSDLGPEEIIAGVKLALQEGSGLDGIVVVGDEEVVQPILQKEKLLDHPKISTFHTSEVIGMDEKPIQSLKSKKDSSLVRTVELVRLGSAVAAVSCGNTGALMACSTLRLRPMEGVAKPALATVWPSKDNYFVLLDAGANPQCKPENLVQYALLGNNYAKDALGLEKPRVGLLTIGTEEHKGNELVTETHALLKRLDDRIHYIGPIEGFHLFNNAVDVVVTDGFTGNVALKTCESLYKMMKSLIKEEVKRNPLNMIGAVMASGILRGVKKRLDPDRLGGAPLLGLRGTVLKAHGSANRREIAAAIRIAGLVVEHKMHQHSLEDIAIGNERMRAAEAEKKGSRKES